MSDRKYAPFEFRVGRLIKDPEERQAGSKTVVSFTIAVNMSYDKHDDYLSGITVWPSASNRAFNNALNLRKGDRVALEGSPNIREYNGKEYRDFTAMSVYKAVDPEADDDL